MQDKFSNKWAIRNCANGEENVIFNINVAFVSLKAMA